MCESEPGLHKPGARRLPSTVGTIITMDDPASKHSNYPSDAAVTMLLFEEMIWFFLDSENTCALDHESSPLSLRFLKKAFGIEKCVKTLSSLPAVFEI